MIISSEELYSHLNSQAPLTEGADISEHPAPGTPVTGYRIYKVYENDKLGSLAEHCIVDKNEIQVDPMGRGFYYWQNRETAEDYIYQTISRLEGLDNPKLLGIGLFRIEGNATVEAYKERGEHHGGFTADEIKVDEDPILFLSKQDIREVLDTMKGSA